MTPKICYIHGAHSTCLGFSQLKSKLPTHIAVDMGYAPDEPVANVVARYQKVIDESEQPVSIVGHSLGGIVAVSLAQRSKNVNQVVTLGTPFGGSAVAGLLRWFVPNNVLFNDIHPHSAVLRALHASETHAPVLSFVTVGGNSAIMQEANDGVVTVKSQLALKGPEYRKVNWNHFEVLLAPEVIQQIQSTLFATGPTL